MADDPNKARSDMRARQAEDGKKAMAEYEAKAAATRIKTEKLRALRLARDAAAPVAPPAAPKVKKAAKSTKSKKKGPEGTLADWLEDQRNSGRNT